ncbi:MAG: Rpn family recombination-promoting nuclease/putative transposase [Chitinispirillales bacterium]|jgi:predicted transposase/invertase (TIGR01784 family)|nr:Rpn family recombination-promoting nuclease/putative transposase [Chitinispirillales bacterium]
MTARTITNTNTKFKNSVFTALFNNEDAARELYNALANTNYGPETKVEITTLEDVLFMEQINDVSFVIDGKIVILIEHQSTINKNIPLRMLLYIARVYEKICENKNLYRKNMITIPRPEFFVLYNGDNANIPDKQTLKLSDMFNNFGKDSPVELELRVPIYNINKGRNTELAKRSKTLDGYETFIELIREYGKMAGNLNSAVKQAIKECLNRDILKGFLENQGSEVVNMLLTEWKLEEALEVSKEEGREEGETQAQRKIAKEMKYEGITTAQIVKFTKLSEAEIEKL